METNAGEKRRRKIKERKGSQKRVNPISIMVVLYIEKYYLEGCEVQICVWA